MKQQQNMEDFQEILSTITGRAWNLYARIYDVAQPLMIRLIGAFGDMEYDEFEEEFVRIADPKPGQKVLDVACGTGRSHETLSAAVGSRGEIIATDISPEMLRRARSRARSLKLEKINYEEADAEKLSQYFDEGSFDLVMSCNGLPNFLRPRKALEEMVQMLKPGGTLAVSTISREQCDRALIWRLGLQFPPGRFPHKDEFREFLKELGLVRITFHDQGLMVIITANKRARRKSRSKE